ncbi:enoyl-CoA hydratase/isomerase family protein [Jiangella alba]|uniref:enoyl-CoA hydratase n=1 Tax=Jiangella alba TaxID=561176 RepID=A0A1H5K0Y0_9ACTN|nr:enoyl-CoA hydratase/isomerase family protein [Jiangella alba]SEE58405.1 short chain enoyl-CoA hydratase [Jiangella alba]
MTEDRPGPVTANLVLSVDDAVATLRIDRPEKRNALDTATRAELIACLDWAGATPDIRAVVVTGTGGSFAAGADLGEAPGQVDPLAMRAMLRERRVYQAVAECPVPVIAMIDGYCLGGGCELAMAADLRIASENATFGQPEIALAIIPGGGGTQRLPRLVGLGQAMRLILTGDRIDAATALRLGLVEQVVPAGRLETATRDLCDRITRHARPALTLAKQAVRASAELPLQAGLALETELLCLAWTSDESAERLAAFRQKR